MNVRIPAVAMAGFLCPALAAQAQPRTAVAEIRGCTDATITGCAQLSEIPSQEGVKQVLVELTVRGLPDGKHGVLIHETANCTPCAAAGGHFDPGPAGNPSPDGNHPFHSGDLVNIDVHGGTGSCSRSPVGSPCRPARSASLIRMGVRSSSTRKSILTARTVTFQIVLGAPGGVWHYRGG
jgi:Cu/Zn superoxide dismutase